MKGILSIVMIMLVFASKGADPKYPVYTIAEDLKKDVNVVYRVDKSIFTIISKSRASHYVHQAITILNEKGKHYASEVVGYDKLSKIKDFNGSVYDANGKLIKRLKNNEIQDQSAFDGYSLYSDARLKAIDLSQGSYPYTVEWEYEVEYKYLFHIPSFVVTGENISVETGSFTLRFPADLAPRYKCINISAEPTTQTLADGVKEIAWNFQNVKPIVREPHSPPASKIFPLIQAAPSVFEYDQYSGSMKSWDEFGRWISSLNRGRNTLPEATKQKVRELTSKAKTVEEKTKILYEYLQSKTRYVSIQLGIGGYQPFEASVVDQYGYGDCKALSNYMVAMLNEAGIKGYYALIYAGEDYRGLDVSFPSAQFNHAIVAVPNGADTIWLECTSQTNPFGYQGQFTGERKALLITEQGAAVVNTTKYSANVNLQSRIADVYLEATGDATAKVKTTYTGLQYENDNLNVVVNRNYDEQKKWVEKTTKIPAFDVKSFAIKNRKDRIPAADVDLNLELRRLATVSGKRLFISPNIMNRSTYVPQKNESRKTSIVRSLEYTDVDTIVFHLPEQIYPEYLPEGTKIKTQFGEYETSYKVDAGSLVYIRKVRMNKGEFPASSYNEFVEFYKSINKADNTKLVFMNKT